MAHDARTRSRARTLYVAGRGIGRIADTTGVSRATLQRWSAEEDWTGLRDQARALEREATALAVEMTRAARQSSDPQQAYAALQAAKLAGISETDGLHPPPEDVAKALLVVLARDPEFGPLVRRRRKDVIDLVMRELGELEVAR